MRIPRIILNPSIAGWIRLWQRERQENARLRRELREWQNKTLQVKNVTPLFTLPEKIEVKERPPVGLIEKNRRLAEQSGPTNIPTAEQVLNVN